MGLSWNDMSETKPVLQALLLADQVYQDQRTGKKVIAGTFNKLWSPRFPAQLGRTTFAFICITDIRGRATLRLQYRDLSDNSVLMQLNEGAVVEAASPNDSIELIVAVPGFPMPRPGVYSFDVVHEVEILGSLRINVVQRTNPESGNQQ